MSQVSTTFHQPWGVPGHQTRGDGEPESIVSPVKPQITTLTMGSDPMPNKVYKLTFPLAPNLSVVHEFNPGGALSAAAFATALAASLQANGATEHLFAAEANANTDTLTHRDTSRAFAVPVSDQPEITAAITQVKGGTLAQFGTLYAYDAVPSGKGGVTATPRRARPVRSLQTGDTAASIKGVVAREYNSTTLDPSYDNTAPGGYRPGQAGFGVKRGHMQVRIDPKSDPLVIDGPVYAIIATGAYDNVNYVAAAADGANTVLISGGDDPLARVTQEETTTTIGDHSVRTVEIKFNRTS